MSTAQAPDVSRGNNGMNSMNIPGGIGGANGNINSVMNAMLANNVMQQQHQQQQAQGMNPQVLQMMMAQGINPMMMGQMGMNNFFPQAMMNPSMGMMGGMGNFNAMGGGNNMNVQAAAANNQGNANVDGGDVLAQLMMNPMAMQMMSQGINPMMLLGMSGMGQGQIGIGNANPYGAPNGVVGVGLPVIANTAAPGDGTVASAPHLALNKGANMPGVLAREDGVLKYPIMNSKGEKKSSKKMKLKDKPKRPLSAYNFFFREERACILNSITKKTSKTIGTPVEIKVGDEEDGNKEEDVKKSVGKEDLKDSKAMKKEEVTEDDDIIHDAVSEKKGEEDGGANVAKGYDEIGVDGKKIPHGKIGFENLAKEIGKRWQQLKPEEIEKFKKLADEDMARYKREMETFLAKKAQSEGAVGGGDSMPPFFLKRSGDVGDNTKQKKKKRMKKIE
ncbi:hypothetical protein ACHAXA_006194 [Cyclostephanos tholiformis]|uniref:HMG box domain-containing protein n=1 Tax=Cyclostephanos tholiformis TaxID=382380 RepID=A0ABD3RT91_9STRA